MNDDSLIPDQEAAHPRSSRRDSMLLLVPLRTADGTETLVRVRNISEGGLMAETAVTFAVGDEISTDLRGIGVVPGWIAWARDGKIGVSFARPIDPKLTRRKIGGVRS